MNITNKVGKEDKKWGPLSSFHVSFLRSESLKAISIYVSESSYHTLSEYGMFYSGLIHRS